jgi:hypothetical protein
MTDEKRTRFRRANKKIDELVNNPLIAEDVRRYAAERETVNRIYARGLAEIRKASNLTQQEMATLPVELIVPTDDPQRIIHADKLRPKFYKYLQ